MGEARHDIDGYQKIVNESIESIAQRLEVTVRRLRRQEITQSDRFSAVSQAVDFVREYYNEMTSMSAMLTNLVHHAEVLDRCVAANAKMDADDARAAARPTNLPRWTGHGYWIGDGPEEFNAPDAPRSRVRCGGPRGCAECGQDLADRRRALGMEPAS